MESTPYHIRRYSRVTRKQERIQHVVKTIVYNECLRKILYGGFQGSIHKYGESLKLADSTTESSISET